jgi:hypothetical protein
MKMNEFILEEMEETITTKRLLPAQQYLKTFKNGNKVPVLTIDMFYDILEHLAAWEKIEIRMAVLKGKHYEVSPDEYIKSNFDEIKEN